MKIFKISLAVVAATLVSLATIAQSFDAFGPFPVLTVITPTQINGATTQSNLPVDIRLFTGIVNVPVMCWTNGGGSVTVQLRQAANTNGPWTDITAIAKGVPTTIYYTNAAAGASIYATNNWVLPGTVTSPTAATAGWASTYLLPAQYTNSGAITVGTSTTGVQTLAFNADDVQRYFQIIYVTTGAASTNSLGAAIIGRVHNGVFVNSP